MNSPNKKTGAARTGSSSRVAGSSRTASEADALPDVQDVTLALAPVRGFADGPAFARVRGFLHRLAQKPPQVLLFEGGDVNSRLAAAHYWAALLNCTGTANANALPPSASSIGLPGLPLASPAKAPATDHGDGQAPPPGGRPCLACPDCVRMLTNMHRDFFFFDGVAASIKIDDVRALRGVLGEPPREAAYRVCVFREAQALVEAAANALLKSFEDPRPGTSFVLLAPQRERLLPTLVSRSVALTLPWPTPKAFDACASIPGREVGGDDGFEADRSQSLAIWEAALVSFLRTGRGFFEKSGSRGAVDASLVQEITSLCRCALLERLRSNGADADAQGLAALLSPVPEPRLRMLDEALAECQESLVYGVNPVLVLEWLVSRMYFIIPRKTS